VGTAQVQGKLWGAAARDWAELAEPVQKPFFEAALDALGITTGTRLLDAGCGAGLALVLAAERGATVTGLDASAGLLEIARERLPEADLREGDLEALPFADDAFDAVTAFNSIQYAGDPTAALREIGRVARPGGRIAVTTWGPPEQCEMRAVLGAIGSLLPPPPPGAAGPFALAAPGALAALVAGAGLTAERTIDVPTPYAHDDFDAAVRSHLASGPARRAIDTAGFDATHDAITAVCEQARQPDGSVKFDNIFKVLIART
jgi:SAM-dependent methyltransferase